jgi:murein DD-endopeptidase MepM/ murein hydrolase activator NlpD
MDSYNLIWVKDAHSRPVQISIPKRRVRDAAIAAIIVVLIGAVAVWDYWRLRADNAELADLRIEATEQREQIALFGTRLADVDGQLERVAELERKVRIIANLPGAAGVGGDDLVEIVPTNEDGTPLPIGVPLDQTPHTGQGGGEPLEVPEGVVPGVAQLEALEDFALGITSGAETRSGSLEDLLGQLEDKGQKLASSPSIWPTKGWMTSRFGPRISPFTGRSQQHNGIDIAAAGGTKIVSPARGRVSFAGRKGPLGNALVVDHGFGVKTWYGHTEKIFVKTGETVERGQLIAAVGSSGRSTGPHLHYVVEVNGKPRNPLDYIFD